MMAWSDLLADMTVLLRVIEIVAFTNTFVLRSGDILVGDGL